MVARLGDGDHTTVTRGGYLLLLALAGLLALVFYYPLALVLTGAFRSESGWSLSALTSVISDPYYVNLIWFTIVQAAYSTLLSLGIGLVGAYILARYDFPGKRTIRSLTVIPFVLPAIVVALGFILFFGNSGYLNRALICLFGLSRPPLRILYSLTGIVLAHAFYNAPIVMRVVSASWEGFDPSIDEAAVSLGAGRLRRFIGITLPRLMPAILSSSALVFVFTFLSFPIVLTLGGARYATIEVGIYTLVRTLLDYNHGAALILVEMSISLFFTYLYLRAEGHLAIPTQGSRRLSPRRFLAPPVSIGKALIALYVLLVGIFFLGPIVSIIVDSLHTAQSWSIANYAQLLSQRYSPFLGTSPFATVRTSLIIGSLATMISLLVGTTIAFFVVRTRIIGRWVIEAALMAPLAVSSVAIGFALLRGLSAPPLHLGGTLAAIVIAHAVLIYPFVVRVLRPILEGLDPALVEAARSLGSSRGRAFVDVELPLLRRGLLVAAVFAFALSMGEMSATIILMRPGLSTIPIAVYGLLSARQFGAASAMAVVLIAITAVSFIVIDRLGQEKINA
ncbi:MAG: iron ABC transporter permease [Candidatus Bipolaricaulota bacterium]|nr:iron ABC transporter permease [Candidatus Bipolaricaulota bacterium]